MSEETKVDLGSSTLSGKQLESILDKLFEKNKPNIVAWQEQMRKDHEDNFIEIKDYVAIIDVGINQIGSWDGANGYHEMTAEQYVDWMQSINPDYSPEESVYLTRQGLLKKYRFQLIINDMGDPYIISNVYFIPADKAIKSGTSSVEMMQRRIDI
jgi:hypothetical protein